MEFMYCIPDLEVFIDKTIKKCLLEYDLDANDTEAVLDDMEKAWPKSPTRHTEKQVLKDCNDNTEKGRRYRHRSGTSQIQETVQTIDKLGDSVLHKRTHELADRIHSNEEHPAKVSNEKIGIVSGGGESNRSDTSSPDAADGKSQSQKHAKLKSRLQQRYFEGHETKNVTNDRVDESREVNKLVPSNLDLLASAANIHTEAHRGTEEHRIQAIRRLQEDSERHFQDIDSRSCLKDTTDGSQPAREMPVLTRLVSSPSIPARPHPMQCNNSGSSVVSGPYMNSMRTFSQESCLKQTPNTPSKERPVFISARPKDDGVTPHVNIDKAKRLLQHYQNGYHSVIPPETVVIRRQIISSDDRNSTTWEGQSPTLITQPGFARNTLSDLSESTAPYHPLATHPHYLQHNQNYLHMFSDTFSEPLPLHVSRSRISSIIAEELQKDSSFNPNTPSRQTASSVERTIPTVVKYSAAQDMNSEKPLQLDRAMSGEPAHRPLQISQAHKFDFHHHMVNDFDSDVRSPSRTTSQLLPAHLVRPNHNSGSSILAFHLGHVTSSSNSIINESNVIVSNIGVTKEDDQPQDLSLKSRKNLEVGVPHNHHSCTNMNMNFPVTKCGRREYFSSPNSPLSTIASGHHNEFLTLRKSSSPSNNSDKECDYNSGGYNRHNPHKTSGKWEKIGQVHSLDNCPSGDSRIFVEKRREESLQRWSDYAGSETNKKRKME